MFGRCALRLRQCIHLARKRGVLSRRSTAGSGPLVRRQRQVHRCGVFGCKGAGRKRLAQKNALETDVSRQIRNDMSPRVTQRSWTEAPYKGDPGTTSVSVKKISDHALEETDKRDGK